jgi:hypothetical protein
MKKTILLLAAALLAPTLALAEITADQIAGKTLTLRKNVFVVGTDGSLTGKTEKDETLVGTWEVKKGRMCRTITEPARLAGSACQSASIKGKTLTLIRDDGSAVAYKMK